MDRHPLFPGFFCSFSVYLSLKHTALKTTSPALPADKTCWVTERWTHLEVSFEQRGNGRSCLRGQGENCPNGSLAPQHAVFVSGPSLSGATGISGGSINVCVCSTSIQSAGTGRLCSSRGFLLEKKASLRDSVQTGFKVEEVMAFTFEGVFFLKRKNSPELQKETSSVQSFKGFKSHCPLRALVLKYLF